MPFKSQAQRRKFAELLVTGEIPPQTFEEWNRETGTRKLPERVKRKPSAPVRQRRPDGSGPGSKRKAAKKGSDRDRSRSSTPHRGGGVTGASSATARPRLVMT